MKKACLILASELRLWMNTVMRESQTFSHFQNVDVPDRRTQNGEKQLLIRKISNILFSEHLERYTNSVCILTGQPGDE